jgi:nucleotide-binding universal stress UspA family protein
MGAKTLLLLLDERADVPDFDEVQALAATLGVEAITAVAAGSVTPPGHGVPAGPALMLLREREIGDAFVAMRETLEPRARGFRFEWRARICADPTGWVLEQAARCDLIATSRPGRRPLSDIDIGRLILLAGRPVLVLPRAFKAVPVTRVAIGYRNTREGRLVVQAALPLMRRADQVFVIGMGKAAPEQDLTDVVAWLGDHGVFAQGRHVEGPATAASLTQAAQQLGGQVLVSGAYGHGQTRERLFGGVTRDLIEDCALPWLTLH